MKISIPKPKITKAKLMLLIAGTFFGLGVAAINVSPILGIEVFFFAFVIAYVCLF